MQYRLLISYRFDCENFTLTHLYYYPHRLLPVLRVSEERINISLLVMKCFSIVFDLSVLYFYVSPLVWGSGRGKLYGRGLRGGRLCTQHRHCRVATGKMRMYGCWCRTCKTQILMRTLTLILTPTLTPYLTLTLRLILKLNQTLTLHKTSTDNHPGNYLD